MLISQLITSRVSFAHLFYAAALTPAIAVAAYGGLISLNETTKEAAARQEAFGKDYTLKYADGKIALIETEDGLLDVTVGTSLPAAGHVTAIEMRNGHWTITTSKHLTLSKK